ncbi:S49 family peptidase [Ponticoccus alexandrii]|uniref:S49 family peptidase n=1 Tax=Ponticoccus alexandrii TaxID=1943633 RepID=A0ABX7F7M2_9RHOB|nr:S49 family peptidase [Ponticoccus alexandrii]ETA53975.1 peptidase S49 [Rhodobacteraceae bacterium PD-2]QRF66373.1 S49 family peptidase [Ponticoccus alexandrii]
MTDPVMTVASLFQGAALAAHMPTAQGLLNMACPAQVSAGTQAALTGAQGERFTVSRGLAVVPLRGLITPNMFVLERWLGWSTCHGIEATMGELAASDDVAAIVLVCDSPGGNALAVPGAAAAVAAANAVKPVHALIHPLCASAAYWIASQARDIAITPGSWVGSVGVLHTAMHPVQPGASGFQMFLQASSHARAKVPDPSTDTGRAEVQRRLDAMEADFHASVAAGRGLSVEDLRSRMSTTDNPADGGAVFWGQEAVTRGLADTVETEAAFWQRIGAAYAPRPARTTRRGAQARAAAAQALASI